MTDRFTRAQAAFGRLCEIMAQLRGPNGCPWDRQQTLESLKPYLIEEAYETLEAIERGEPRAHCEELGDLLLQVVFQAEIAHGNGHFDMAHVADGIANKLVRRHPHVFADVKADNAQASLKAWEAVKAKERHPASSCLEGIPRALPGLVRAWRTGEKAAAVGFDWPDAGGAQAKVAEEWAELQEALAANSGRDAVAEELGDLLFAVVNLSRHLRLDPEEALRTTIDKFHQRFRYIEAELAKQQRPIREVPLDELDKLWEESKALSRSHHQQQ